MKKVLPTAATSPELKRLRDAMSSLSRQRQELVGERGELITAHQRDREAERHTQTMASTTQRLLELKVAIENIDEQCAELREAEQVELRQLCAPIKRQLEDAYLTALAGYQEALELAVTKQFDVHRIYLHAQGILGLNGLPQLHNDLHLRQHAEFVNKYLSRGVV